MTDQLISFETAKLAKEKGFDEPVLSYWWDSNPNLLYGDQNTLTVSWHNRNGDSCGYYVSAPTQSLLQKWLREIHNIIVWVYPNLSLDGYQGCIQRRYKKGISPTTLTITYLTYEEALEQGLVEALKLIK